MTTYTNSTTNTVDITSPWIPASQLLGHSIREIIVDDVHADKMNKLFSPTEIIALLDAKRIVRDYVSMFLPLELNREKVVIAGGCFASVINAEPVKDYDVFILEDQCNRDITHMMKEVHRRDSNVRVGSKDYMNNENIEHTLFFHDNKIQYITTSFKTREELIKHFDFRHCCVSYDFATDKLYITREVYDLIRTKTLAKNTDKMPAQWRYEKFVNERGWKAKENILHSAYVTWKG